MPPVKRSEEQRYFRALKRVFNDLIQRLSFSPMTAQEIAREARRFVETDEVTGYLNRAANRMVRSERAESARSWKEAVTKGTSSRMLYELVQKEMNGPVGNMVHALIADQVGLIKTIPNNWARWVVDYIYRETLKGKRPEQIEKELREKLPEYCTRNLKCVARTESAKANAAIVQARAEMCGIQAYFWRCVADERSRDSHIGMDGVLVFYNDPPNPEALFPGNGKPYGNYHAGNTFNCRCFQEPVVDVRFLPDVMRVHDHGEIRTMTKAAVLKKYGRVA